MAKVILLIGLGLAIWSAWDIYNTVRKSQKRGNTPIKIKSNKKTTENIDKTISISRRNSINRQTVSRDISSYELIKEIGSGHYGKALLVRDKNSHREFVLKEIPLEIYENHDILKNEHLIHSSLNNKFIVKYYGFMVTEDFVYIILEYAQRGDLLDHVLNHGAFDEVTTAKIISQLVCGINYMHQLNIVHRDIKPENILLFDDGLVKICDFGLCGILPKDNKKLKGAGIGTLVYRSPELVLSLPHNEKTDIWSIGVLAYILLTNESPFEDNEEFEITNRILKADYTLLDDNFSPEAQDFIYSCIQVNPMHRPSTQELLNHPWIS